MVNGEESPVSRSTKDGRIGSGGKLSSQKAARRCSSGIAPVSGCRSAARSIQSHLHLFTTDHNYCTHKIGMCFFVLHNHVILSTFAVVVDYKEIYGKATGVAILAVVTLIQKLSYWVVS